MTRYFAWAICMTFVLILVQFSSNADAEPIEIGYTETIASTALGRDMTIMVHLPDGYSEGDQSYPVIYALEGQWYFSYLVSLFDRTVPNEHIPPAIIVGLEMSNPSRFGILRPGGEESALFRQFLGAELITHINTHYRTTDHRLLLGWEFGGAFTLETLALQPDLFSGYVASSPYPIGSVSDEISARGLTADFAHKRFLYVGVSQSEGVVNQGIALLEDMLSTPEQKWSARVFAGDRFDVQHLTSAYPVFRAGINRYFDDFPHLRPENAAELRAMGGVTYAKDYYARRGAKYGTTPELDFISSWWLFRVSIESQDFQLFEELAAEVDIAADAAFGPYRFLQYAQFYNENGHPDRGLALLEAAHDHFPDNQAISDALTAARTGK